MDRSPLCSVGHSSGQRMRIPRIWSMQGSALKMVPAVNKIGVEHQAGAAAEATLIDLLFFKCTIIEQS